MRVSCFDSIDRRGKVVEVAKKIYPFALCVIVSIFLFCVTDSNAVAEETEIDVLPATEEVWRPYHQTFE